MTLPRNTPAAPQSGATEGRNGSAGEKPRENSGPLLASLDANATAVGANEPNEARNVAC